MESLALLPELLTLPESERSLSSDFESTLRQFDRMDRETLSIELSEGIEDSLLRVFEARNIPDDVADAHGLSFTHSSLDVHDHYLDMVAQ